MSALDFPDNPVVGEQYGSASTAWRWNGTLWESTSASAGARGIVATGTFKNGGAMTVPLNGLAPITNPISLATVAGRRYRASLTVRAANGDTVAGFVGAHFRIDNAVMPAQIPLFYVPPVATGYGSIVYEWIFAGSGTTRTFDMCLYGYTASTVYAEPGISAFTIEDVTYEAGAVGPGGGASGTGVEASKPATPNPGYRFFATDTLRDWLYDGTGWIVMSEPDQAYAPTVGDINTMGPVNAFFRRSNGYCDFRIAANFAAGFVIYANPRYSLPRAPNTSGPGMFGATVDADYFIAGYGNIEGLAMLHIADYVTLFHRVYTGVPGLGSPITPTTPTTWTVGSAIYIQGRYPMANRYI